MTHFLIDPKTLAAQTHHHRRKGSITPSMGS
jgi:hypothetical protein